jgi:hypothetical protein
MITWTWESSAPGAEGRGESSDEDEAKAAAAARMHEHLATAARADLKFGLQWRHYRGGEALGQAEIFDPGHEPELAWRLPGPAPTDI